MGVVELPPQPPAWDDAHDITVEHGPYHQRGRCSCGWIGRWRRGKAAGWDAQADADEHHNNVS